MALGAVPWEGKKEAPGVGEASGDTVILWVSPGTLLTEVGGTPWAGFLS